MSTVASIEFQGGGIRNDDIASGAAIVPTKMSKFRHSFPDQIVAPATTVTAQTKVGPILRGATGELIAFEAAIYGAITGDYTVTVDLKKSTGGGAFATVLSSTIGFSSTDAVRTAKSSVISSTSLVDGDILETVVTVSGSSGTQATGLSIDLTWDESPT